MQTRILPCRRPSFAVLPLLALLCIAVPPVASAQTLPPGCPEPMSAPVGTASTGATPDSTSTSTGAVGDSVVTTQTCPEPPPPPPPPPPGPRQAPIVSLTPHHSAYRDVTQGSAVVSYSTPAYVSRDEARSLTLLFASGQARPRGFVQVDVSDQSQEKPIKMSIRLRRLDWTWVDFSNGTQEIFYHYNPSLGTHRLAAQFHADGLASRAHSYDVLVRSWWADGSFTEAVPVRVRVPIVNERSSPLGLGWSVAGLQRLHDQGDGAFILGGDGTGTWFARPCGTCAYVTPDGDFTTLTKTGSGWERRYPDGTKAFFNASGLFTRIEDRFGNRTSYGYDGSWRLTSVTDPAGKQITLGYHAGGGLSWIHDPGGRQVNTAVHAGLLFHFTDPDGIAGLDLHFSGDWLEGYWPRSTGRWMGEDARWHFTYDTWERVAAATAPAVALGDLLIHRPATQHRSLELAVLPAAGTGSYGSPAAAVATHAVRVQVTTPRGHTTQIAVDRFGNPTRVEEPGGRVTSLWRNARGQIGRIDTPSGDVTHYTWSGVQLQSVYNQTTGQTISYTYESTFNQPLTVTGDTQRQWFFYSGSQMRLDSMRVGENTQQFTTKFVLDSSGRLTQKTEPGGRHTIIRRRAGGFQNTDSVLVGMQKFRRTAYRYDGFGRTVGVKNPLNDSTITEYDLLNRVRRTVDATGLATGYDYGSVYLTSVTDARNQVYGFSYNVLGWLGRETDPLGRAFVHHHDANGNVTRSVNRRGQAVTFGYDALDRPLWRYQHAEGVQTSWEYHPQDQWVRITHPNSGTEEVRFDPTGRVTHEVSRGHTLSSTYDKRNLRTGVSLSGTWTRSIGYRYNARMQLDTLIDFSGQRTHLVYDRDGRKTDVVLPSGLNVGYRYSSVHRATRIEYTDNAALDRALGTGYSHESRGWVEKRHVAQFDTARVFTYDKAGRLRFATDEVPIPGTPSTCGPYFIDPDTGEECRPEVPGSSQVIRSVEYTYDESGNRTDRNAVIGAANRPSAFDGYAMTYDEDGNLLSKSNGTSTQTYAWNSLGQLTSVTTNGHTISYAYGGRDQLVTRLDGGYAYRYVYDGDNLFLETIDGWGEPHRVYAMYPGVDRPHSLEQWTPGEGRSTHTFATDELGTVTGLIGPGQQLSGLYRYDAWGQPEHYWQQAHNTLHLAGRYRDWQTGLYYNRNRWYDPHQGRFISEDPIRLAGGINLYAYVGNNPVNYTDPYGLCKWDDKGNQIELCIDDEIIVIGTRGGGEWFDRTSGRTRNPSSRGGPGYTPTAGGGRPGRPASNPKPTTDWGRCAGAWAATGVSLAFDLVPAAGVARIVAGGAKAVLGMSARSAATSGLINVSAISANSAIAGGTAYYARQAERISSGSATSSLGWSMVSPGSNLDTWGHQTLANSLVGSTLTGAGPELLLGLFPFVGTALAFNNAIDTCP